MYNTYIFDLYGTLVDIHTDEDQSLLWDKLSAFFRFQKADYTPQELKETYLALVEEALSKPSPYEIKDIQIEFVFKKLYEKKHIFPEYELIEYTCQFFRILSTEYLKLYDGAKELLTSLKETGASVYLLSNAQRIFTEFEMKELGIYDMFDGILYSSDAGCQKPDQNFFSRLFVEFSIDSSKQNKKKCLMIGNDATSDIKGAREFGLDSFYLHSNQSPEVEGEIGATYEMKELDLGKVREMLLGM